ncbi:tripartite tricarboxylate transporter substrate binding protein [Polynucleobacter sp. AP-Titi-500A-B4]|uniref:Bug family tripartite tricarboxylate transporter substrate binding protein n=1 Tax=Polynucleobacter sp. AP-Titi-500A-B4 TaxID=2576923 RepID=UPI001BFDD255|nr:tripartite tricarboxylate transporter substrate binding protein [Polynucleobacter sp. AP-Titi-500A-B4]QWE13167.1 tripartite tricarboxylate transporter substrate binding protein [Polynucleobacter sp. AP-Titi-500A-B4]
MRLKLTHWIGAAVCATLFATFITSPAIAQSDAAVKNYPDKPIRLVIPFPPGGATDVIGRIMAQELSKSLNQQVVPDNRAGDSGNIGADLVAKSPADGYTLLMGALTSHAINTNLDKDKIKYNLEKDFTPVAIVGVVPLVFVVNPSVPVKNMKEFIAYAKANPGKLTFASSGAGAPQRLAMEMFRFQLGLDMLHIPYKGSGPAMTDLVGGQVLSMSETVPAALQFIQAGQLRALAVTTAKRISQLPDVPTVTEATGLPNFDVVSMFGIEAPAGTPSAIVNKLSADIKTILQRPDVQERMLAAGVYVNYLSPADSSKRITRELNMWAKVVKDANVKAD